MILRLIVLMLTLLCAAGSYGQEKSAAGTASSQAQHRGDPGG